VIAVRYYDISLNLSPDTDDVNAKALTDSLGPLETRIRALF
jgi:hypothetical protein